MSPLVAKARGMSWAERKTLPPVSTWRAFSLHHCETSQLFPPSMLNKWVEYLARFGYQWQALPQDYQQWQCKSWLGLWLPHMNVFWHANVGPWGQQRFKLSGAGGVFTKMSTHCQCITLQQSSGVCGCHWMWDIAGKKGRILTDWEISIQKSIKECSQARYGCDKKGSSISRALAVLVQCMCINTLAKFRKKNIQNIFKLNTSAISFWNMCYEIFLLSSKQTHVQFNNTANAIIGGQCCFNTGSKSSHWHLSTLDSTPKKVLLQKIGWYKSKASNSLCSERMVLLQFDRLVHS